MEQDFLAEATQTRLCTRVGNPAICDGLAIITRFLTADILPEEAR